MFYIKAMARFIHPNLNDVPLASLLHALSDPRWNSQLRGVANEAAALAWVTSYPLLVFPGLFQEKAEIAIARAQGCDRKLLEV